MAFSTMPALALPAAFRRTAARYAEQPAIGYGNDDYLTFAEVDQASDRIAAGLAKQGLLPGERLALYAPNGPDFCLAYLGIVKTGAVVVPINVMQSAPEIDYILRDAGVRGLCYDTVFSETVTALEAVAAGTTFTVEFGGETWQRWLDNSAALPPTPEIEPAADLAVLLYTSGTTGHPKGAMLSHANLYTNTVSCMAALQLQPGHDRVLTVLPMFHAFAATVGMLLPLLHGLTLVTLPRFEPEAVARAVGQFRCTVLPAVPSMFNVLLRLPAHVDAQLASLRFCISGGAAMPQALLQRFEERFGIPILEGDGPTECGPVTSVNPVDGERKVGSIGLPIPAVEMRILDEQGEVLPVNTVGEICVSGPNVMRGYWNQPEATAAAFAGDWFRTGDLGYVDEDGYFYIVDRKKDLIIVNGMNVYPRAVEEALYRDQRVAECAVVGEPDARHGEIVVAHIVPASGSTLDTETVRAHCREYLGRHEIPKRIHILDSLPKNAAGKLLKRALRKAGEVERGVDLSSDTP